MDVRVLVFSTAFVLLLTAPTARVASQAASKDLPHAVPREGAMRVLENARVSVWDVTWPPNRFTGMHRHLYDYFGVELADSTFRLTYPDRPARTASVKRGAAWFLTGGAVHGEEGLTDPPRRAILADLLDEASAAYENATSFPDAFPNEHATRVVDSPRVTMWDYSWTPGRDEAPRFYTRDVVVIFVDGGELQSSAPDAKQQMFQAVEGQVLFRSGGRVYGERAMKGAVRAIFAELK